MSNKEIKICVLGNKDSKKEELINLFKQYGNSLNNSKIRIYDFDFLFESFQINEGNWEEKVNKKDINIALLCFDYRLKETFDEIKDFYLKNKNSFTNFHTALMGTFFEIQNKKVDEKKVKDFSKESELKLYNVSQIQLKSSNFEKQIKNLLTAYGKKYSLPDLDFEKIGKTNLIAMKENDYYICKMGLIGSKAGKTTLANTYKTGIFNPNTNESTLMNNVSKIINYSPEKGKEFSHEKSDNIKVKVELWDTPHVGPNNANMNFVMMVAKSVDIIIYLYDNNNNDTFNDIEEWDSRIHNNITKNCIFYIVENRTENKNDNDNDANKLSKEKMKNLAERINVDSDNLLFTDASSNKDVNELINRIVSDYLLRVDIIKCKEEEKIEEKENNVNDDKKKNDNNNNNNNNNGQSQNKKGCFLF